VKENVFIKNKLRKLTVAKFLKKKLKSAGFIDVDIIKTSFNTRVVIYALKPGFVIGKKGENIRALTNELENKFDYNKVHIEIGEIPNKNLDPKVIIENMESNISKGVAWKRVIYGALRKIKEAGAIGAEIIAKGNTTGKGQRKRKSRFFFGYMKKAGDQKNLVDYEKKTTFPGLGTIGIKLRIVNPDVLFTDKVDIEQLSKDYKIKLEEEELENRKKQLEQKEDEKASPIKEDKNISKNKKSSKIDVVSTKETKSSTKKESNESDTVKIVDDSKEKSSIKKESNESDTVKIVDDSKEKSSIKK
jgi:small subunit ribosomal protein S3